MTFDPTGKTVDQILDHGAPGLSYWEQFLPVYTKAFGEGAGVNLAELYARYDEQRGLNLDEFDTARTELDKVLADAESRFTSHRSVVNSLPSAWTGATGTEALVLVNSQLRQAREDLDTIRTASAAIAAALDPIRAAVLTKAERTHALLTSTPDGEAGVTLDGRTPDAISALAKTDPWLTATFRPEIDRQLAAFTATCTATADTIESHYRAIITAFDQVIDHTYPQPSPTLLPQPDPVTSGRPHDPTPPGSSAAQSVPATPESSDLASSGPGAATDPTPSDDAATPPDRATAPNDPSATQTNPAGVQSDSMLPTGPDASPQAANPGPRVGADATGAPGCCASRDTSASLQPGHEGRTCPSVTGPEASKGHTCTAPPSTTALSGAQRGASGAPLVEGGCPASGGSPGTAGPAGGVEPSSADAPNASESASAAIPKWVQPQAELVGQALESLFGKLETGVQQGISAVLEQLGSLSDPTNDAPGDAETPTEPGTSAHPDQPADLAAHTDGSKSADPSPDPGRPGVSNLPSGHLEFDLAGKHFVVDRAPAGDMSLAVTDESGRTRTWTLRTDHAGGLALAPDNPAGQPCTPAADGPGPAAAAPAACPPGNAPPSETARPPDSPGAEHIPDAGSAPVETPGSAVSPPCPDTRLGRQPEQCGPPAVESPTPAAPSSGVEPHAPACPGTPEPGAGEWAPDGGDPSGCQGLGGVGSGRSTICPAAPETAGPTAPPGEGEPPPGGGQSPPEGDVSAGEPSVAVSPADPGAGLASPDVPLEIPEAGVEIPTVSPVPGPEAR